MESLADIILWGIIVLLISFIIKMRGLWALTVGYKHMHEEEYEKAITYFKRVLGYGNS
jgi:hypothetical protein